MKQTRREYYLQSAALIIREMSIWAIFALAGAILLAGIFVLIIGGH